jgi:hypothetical protein
LSYLYIVEESLISCISETSCSTFYVVSRVNPEVNKDQQAMHTISLQANTKYMCLNSWMTPRWYTMYVK